MPRYIDRSTVAPFVRYIYNIYIHQLLHRQPATANNNNNNMDFPQHIRISGTFVIFQGVYGDGVRNTIDYIEPLVSSSLRQQQQQQSRLDDDDDEAVDDINHNNENERDLTLRSVSTGSRGIVTPPPSCPNHILSTTAAAAEAAIETETPTQVSHHNTTTPIPESYVPPTKVAKTSTLEETIIAISATTIHSEFPLEQSEVISSDGDMDDTPNAVVTQDHHHAQQLNDADATEEGDHQLAQIWETECRTIELHHRKEWYENALSQTTTTTVYSSNSQTEKEQYRNILHPQHCLSFTGQEMDNDVHGRTDQIQNDNSSDNNSTASQNIHPSIPWWMSPETGGVAVLDQIPSPPIRIPPPPSIFGVSSSNMLLQLPSPPIQRIGSLAPGTMVVATALITLSRHGHDPDVPGWTPLAIPPIHPDHDDDDTVDTIDDSDQCRDPPPHETKVYLPGRLGWIQLLKIISPMSGYCVLSIDGYSFAGPGLPHHYIPGGRRPRHVDQLPPRPNSLHHSNPHSALLDGWYWRVMCIEGAYVRNGIDLTAHHVATIPYGSLVRVLRKSINAMGLSRLQIEAMYYSSTSNGNKNDSDRPQYITGWISEFLNPLSGQRGPIALPLPFPAPALYEVSLPEGAVIRSDVELSSPIIGHAPFGTVVSVIGCTFTEQPKDRCIARFRLAGNGGYMNVHLNLPSPHDSPVVQFVGMDDEFNPNDPKAFHCRSVQKNIANSTMQDPQGPSSIAPCIYTDPSHLSMVGQNNPMTQQQRRIIDERMRAEDAPDRHNDDHHDDDDDDLLVPLRPVLEPHPTTTTTTHRATTLSARDHHHHARYNLLCVICLCEERTATIIHGETGHIVCCLLCARILQARHDLCPVCRCPIDRVIQHFWA